MDIERVAAAADEVRPGRSLARGILTVIAVIFYALGWLLGFASVCIAWSAAATRVGWQDARKPRGRLTERRGAA